MKITFDFDDDSYVAIVAAARHKKCAVVDLLLDAIIASRNSNSLCLKRESSAQPIIKFQFLNVIVPLRWKMFMMWKMTTICVGYHDLAH